MSDVPSNKPYLIRALHQWCADFGFTPFIAVFVDQNVEVPMEFVKNKYMLGEEFSMLDVAIAPLLWRLEHYGIDLSRNAAALLKYAERIFSRPAYIEALTPSEKVMRR